MTTPTTSAQIQAFSGWDKGLKLEQARANLEDLIRSTRDRREKTYYCVLLVQLMNGARIGEAVACMIKYAGNGTREQRVRVEKRRAKNPFDRLMIIPDLVRKYPQVKTEILASNDRCSDLTNAIANFCRRRLHYNTHAHRYACISELSNRMHPQKIAKLTGHTRLDLIMHYTQTRDAENDLREFIQ